MTAVVDTNVFVSGIISSRGAPFEIIHLWKSRQFDLLTSEEILEEYRRVFLGVNYRPFREMSAEELLQFVEDIRAQSSVVQVHSSYYLIPRDASDNKFVDCAIEGRADCAVTGDVAHFTEKEYNGVRVLSPREFVTAIQLQSTLR